jgi:hypothetical protein
VLLCLQGCAAAVLGGMRDHAGGGAAAGSIHQEGYWCQPANRGTKGGQHSGWCCTQQPYSWQLSLRVLCSNTLPLVLTQPPHTLMFYTKAGQCHTPHEVTCTDCIPSVCKAWCAQVSARNSACNCSKAQHTHVASKVKPHSAASVPACASTPHTAIVRSGSTPGSGDNHTCCKL